MNLTRKLGREIVSAGVGLAGVLSFGGCQTPEDTATVATIAGVLVPGVEDPGRAAALAAAAQGMHGIAQVQAQEQNKTNVNVYVNGNNAQYQQPQRQITIEEWNRMSGEEKIKHVYDNKAEMFFACTRVEDYNRNGLIEPNEYIGIEKWCFSANENIVIGAITFEKPGTEILIRLLPPSRPAIDYKRIVDRDGYVFWELIPREKKEIGRNALLRYANGRFMGKIEFDITP
ncbi:hypothetical protein HYV50_05445 [Candidatus Pacearchaeota archaeon]|nr:hypothetical protein [Candidatus Pacearchaeota archaeon]